MRNYKVSKSVAFVFIIATIYFAAAKLGLSLAFLNASATAVWPPTGIALAALLLLGNRALPGIFLGAFLANVTITGLTLTTIGIAIGNTLEAVVGAWLVNRFASGRNAFANAQGVFKFTILAGLFSTLVSASIGVTSLVLGGFASLSDWGPVWLTWWLGDAVGALLVTPILVLWAERPRLEWNLRRGAELVFLFALGIVVAVLVFDGSSLLGANNYPLEYVIIPVLLWAAFRFGQRQAATLSLIIAGIAIWGTLNSFGPFVTESQNASLVLLQSFMGVISVTSIALAAEVSNRRQIENALRDSRDALKQQVEDQAVSLSGAEANLQLYADIIKHIPLGVAVLHLEKPDDLTTLKIVAINPNTAIITGIRAEDFVGKYLIDIRPENFETDAPKTYAEVIRTGKPRDFGEVRNTDPRIPSEWFAAKIFPLPNNRVAITLEDIGERKKTEEALRQQRELYDSMLRAQSDLGEGVALTEGTRLVYANEALGRLYGYTVEELLAMPSSLDLVAPEERQPLMERFRSRVSGIETPEAVETVAVHKDGHRINIEYAVKVTRDGDRVQLFSIIRDVTARKQAEAALRQSEELFSKAFHASPMGLAISTVDDGRLIEINPAFEKIYGYSRQEAIGRTSTELGLIDPKDRARGIEIFKKQGYLREYQITAHPKSGETRQILSTTEFITFNGKTHILGLTQDITEQKKMIDALRSSEERSRLLIEGVRDYAIFSLDPSGTIENWNPGAERVYGYSRDEVIGQNISRVYTREDKARDLYMHELRVAVEQGKHEVDTWRVHKNGSHFWANVVTHPLKDSAGTLRGFVTITRDITERKRADDKVKGLMESAPDAMVIVDGSGKIQIVNSQTEKLFGYRREELYGKPIEMLIPERLRDQHQIHRAAYSHNPQARAMGAGLELLGLHKSKYEFPVDVSLGPLETDEGTLFTASIRDITARKKEEEALQASEEKFRLVVEGVEDYAIYMVDPEGIVVSWNEGAERINGYREEEILGQNQDRFYTPEDRVSGKPRRGLAAAADKGRFESEGIRVRKDGSRFWAHTITTALRDEEGKLKGFSRITRDITERKRAEEELKVSRESLRTLATRLVESQENERRRIARELHDEFGQVLTGLKMELEAAAHSNSDAAQKTLADAQTQVAKLIAQTRALSLELRPAMLDDLGLLPALLSHIDRFSAQTRMQVDFKQSGLEDQRFSPSIETAAYRIVQEALTNAARHAKVKQVSVRILVNNGSVHLQVEDKGAGFDPDSALAAAASSGLVGMSERVLALGGKFSIESQPGIGTSVIAEIPLAEGKSPDVRTSAQ